jgi:hypothetical protein
MWRFWIFRDDNPVSTAGALPDLRRVGMCDAALILDLLLANRRESQIQTPLDSCVERGLRNHLIIESLRIEASARNSYGRQSQQSHPKHRKGSGFRHRR